MPVAKKAKKKTNVKEVLETRAPAKKLAKKPGKIARKSAKKSGTKKAVKKTEPVVVNEVTTENAREDKPKTMRDELGFVTRSDLARTYVVMKQGGNSRIDVHNKVREEFKDDRTANGNDKPISTLMNQVVSRAKDLGFSIVEGGWNMVPPEGDIPDYTTLVDTTSRRQKNKPAEVAPPPVKKAVKKISKKVAKKAVKKMKKLKKT